VIFELSIQDIYLDQKSE